MRYQPPNALTASTPKRVSSGVGIARRLTFAVMGWAVATVVALATATAAFGAAATVDLSTSSNFGTVLADAQGFALYTLPSDHNGMSTCTGACVPVWPALTVPAGTTPTAGAGVPGTVAAVLQTNGTYQLTYNGAPLYTFVGDTSAGQVSGNGIGGFAVVRVTAPSTPTTAPTTTAAPTTPTTPATMPPAAAPSGTTTGKPTGTTAPAPAPAAAAAAPVSPSAAASATSPTRSSAPTSLAFTGPGPVLRWLAIAGGAMIAVSLPVLLAVRIRAARSR